MEICTKVDSGLGKEGCYKKAGTRRRSNLASRGKESAHERRGVGRGSC